MPYYRCYVLDSGNNIVAVEDASHADDKAAMAWAEEIFIKRTDARGVELWQGARMVDRKLRPSGDNS